jgi:hypothetical protein
MSARRVVSVATSFTTCALVVTNRHRGCSRNASWQPPDIVDVTGPGITIGGRPSCNARPSVCLAPLRVDASTITVPLVRAAFSRDPVCCAFDIVRYKAKGDEWWIFRYGILQPYPPSTSSAPLRLVTEVSGLRPE